MSRAEMPADRLANALLARYAESGPEDTGGIQRGGPVDLLRAAAILQAVALHRIANVLERTEAVTAGLMEGLVKEAARSLEAERQA